LENNIAMHRELTDEDASRIDALEHTIMILQIDMGLLKCAKRVPVVSNAVAKSFTNVKPVAFIDDMGIYDDDDVSEYFRQAESDDDMSETSTLADEMANTVLEDYTTLPIAPSLTYDMYFPPL